MKHVRRLDIVAGRRIDDVQHAVAGDEIDLAAPLRIGRSNHRCRAAAAGPKEVVAAGVGVATGIDVLAFVGPVPSPDDLAGVDVEPVQVVGDAVDDANLPRPAGAPELSDNQHRHQRVQRARCVIGLNLPLQPQRAHVVFRQDLLVPDPSRALVIGAVGQVVDQLTRRRRRALCVDGSDDETGAQDDDTHDRVLSCQRSCGSPKA